MPDSTIHIAHDDRVIDEAFLSLGLGTIGRPKTSRELACEIEWNSLAQKPTAMTVSSDTRLPATRCTNAC